MASDPDDPGRHLYQLLWDSQAKPHRGPKPTLSLAAIAHNAIDVADAEGLAAVTMQRIADELGVTKMALYRYLFGKTELIALMTETVMAEGVRLDAVAGGWRPTLHEWTRRLFALFIRHPWLAETTTAGARPIGPHELGWAEQAAAALAGTGLRGAEIIDVAGTLANHARAMAQHAPVGDNAPEQRFPESLLALVRGREDRFPALATTLDAVVRERGDCNTFEFGLARILDGVELFIRDRGSSQTASL